MSLKMAGVFLPFQKCTPCIPSLPLPWPGPVPAARITDIPPGPRLQSRTTPLRVVGVSSHGRSASCRVAPFPARCCTSLLLPTRPLSIPMGGLGRLRETHPGSSPASQQVGGRTCCPPLSLPPWALWWRWGQPGVLKPSPCPTGPVRAPQAQKGLPSSRRAGQAAPRAAPQPRAAQHSHLVVRAGPLLLCPPLVQKAPGVLEGRRPQCPLLNV